jgi:type IV pilus assembly protein PilW
VKTIEVSVLMDGQIPLESLGASETAYAYGADGITAPVGPAGHRVRPADQGFSDKLLRREFTALVALRNYNP